MSAEVQLIKCELCNKQFRSITNTHLIKKHNITTKEYAEQYPLAKFISDEHIQKFKDWSTSEKNITHIKKLQQQNSNSIHRIEQFRKVAKTEKYRKTLSDKMKEVVKTLPNSIMWKSVKGAEHHHYKRSNYQRWLEKFGEEEANIRLVEWKRKNKQRSKSKNTSIELIVKSFLEQHTIKYIQQYDKISSYYVDFYLPEYNLVIECFGDYWHANPKKYNAEDAIKYPGAIKFAKDVWLKDKQRIDTIISHGYNIECIFESQIKSNVSIILEMLSKLNKI